MSGPWNSEALAEDDLEPDLPIVDPHHHLWLVNDEAREALQSSNNPYAYVRRTIPRYLHDELAADLASGHNVVATVYAECGSMYRASNPALMRSLGEVEFANGIAAMFESGGLGRARACLGIVGHADLTLGDPVAELLEAQMAASDGRFKGIRQVSAYDAGMSLFAHAPQNLLAHGHFRAGFKWLQRLGLSFDAWMLEPQLDDLVQLAQAFPETSIILDHCGSPLGIEAYRGRLPERFPVWREAVRGLARCENITMKLGGLGMPICGFPSFRQQPPASARQLAAEWTPYFETCIEAFGAERCMFESNFPTEAGSCTYRTLWNAFKGVVSSYSAAEKHALFSQTAARVYRLALPHRQLA
jgi:L-fuconolactonase